VNRIRIEHDEWEDNEYSVYLGVRGLDTGSIIWWGGIPKKFLAESGGEPKPSHPSFFIRSEPPP
jgi:hypothetical protein